MATESGVHQLTLTRLMATGSVPVGLEGLEKRLMDGEVIVVRNGMQIGGALEQTRETIFAAIEEVAGRETAEKARHLGLERIHELADVETIDRFHTLVTARLRRRFLPLTERIVRELFGKEDFWINYNAVMRFYVPNEIMTKGYALLKKKTGKLVQHGPHHDVWQSVALNAINIWMAVERVSAENGMIVFPDHFGKIFPRGGEHVRRDQHLGIPVKTVCEPGDIVLFHSQHLHGGILNRSSDTRVVITTRFALTPPMHPRMGGALLYTSAAAIRSGKEWREKAAILRERLRFVNILQRIESNRFLRGDRGRPGQEETRVKLFDPMLKGNWYPEVIDRSGDEYSDPAIRAVDDNTIAVTVHGEEHELQRRCPHQGADLARGYVCDGRLHCPWHDQPFDVRTGKAEGACAGLKPLRTRVAVET